MKGNTCATDVLRQDIVEDAYCIVENLIRRICWKFQKRYGGEFEEWLSEANEIFMEAFHNHDGTKSAFITWLYYRLNWGLYDRLRERNLNKTVHWTDADNQEHTGIVVGIKGMKATIVDSLGREHRALHRELLRSDPVSFDELGDEDNQGEALFEAPSNTCITSLLEHVEDSTRELWSLFVDPPAELLGELDPEDPQASWDAIQRYIVHGLRWNLGQLWTAIREMKELCTE